jgi:hypothetical protein
MIPASRATSRACTYKAANVRFWVESGHAPIALRISPFGPKPDIAARRFDSPQTSDIFVLDGGLLDSTLVRVGTVASAGMYDYASPPEHDPENGNHFSEKIMLL